MTFGTGKKKLHNKQKMMCRFFSLYEQRLAANYILFIKSYTFLTFFSRPESQGVVEII